MDLNDSKSGLATLLHQHGCSTQVTKGEWIKVTRKSGGAKDIKDDKAKATYAEALMKAKTDKADTNGSSKLGFRPAAEIKINKNSFELLDQDDEEPLK